MIQLLSEHFEVEVVYLNNTSDRIYSGWWLWLLTSIQALSWGRCLHLPVCHLFMQNSAGDGYHIHSLYTALDWSWCVAAIMHGDTWQTESDSKSPGTSTQGTGWLASRDSCLFHYTFTVKFRRRAVGRSNYHIELELERGYWKGLIIDSPQTVLYTSPNHALSAVHAHRTHNLWHDNSQL